ncbi:MAG: hypothetical protein IPK50_15210 [Fibrobacterota bacterium]|nr:hypothetical protein [Fibrobacterota bacterium]QQS03641.1 MAG: hypothetical protein IPK50_15210 [Fibrobacterota bacterium]
MIAMGWLLVFGGCSAAWPFGGTPEVDPRERMESEIRSNYPSSEFFSGLGESSSSADEAEIRARTKVAEQIDLSIQSTFTSLVKEERDGKSANLSTSALWQTSKQTHFENAQMIHCDPPRRTKSGWIVAASLSRRGATDAMTLRYEDSAKIFRRLTGNALAAPDLEAFTTSWSAAWAKQAWLELQGIRFLSLSGAPLSVESMGESHPYAPFREDRRSFRRLDSARISWLASQRIQVRIDSIPQFSSLVSDRLRQMGIAAASDAKANWELTVVAQRLETESAIGEIMICRIVPRLVLKEIGGRIRETDFLDQVAGKGQRLRDMNGACSDAFSKLDASKLESPLRSLLGAVFPIH